MARRLNFTGRKSIGHADVRIRVVQVSGQLGFTAEFNLDSYRFPADASVYVEAYRGLSALWKRFDFGTVGSLHPPQDMSLKEFGHPEGVLFRVKVTGVGEHNGRLCGEVDGIRPQLPGENDAHPQPLIDVDKGPLGGELWQVRFPDSFSGMPHLILNERIEDWHLRAKDPLFRALVLPTVMREILIRVLILRTDLLESDSEQHWPRKWLTFAATLPGVGSAPDPLGEAEDLDEREDLNDWIDQAVSAFGQRSGLTDSLISRWNQEASV